MIDALNELQGSDSGLHRMASTPQQIGRYIAFPKTNKIVGMCCPLILLEIPDIAEGLSPDMVGARVEYCSTMRGDAIQTASGFLLATALGISAGVVARILRSGIRSHR